MSIGHREGVVKPLKNPSLSGHLCQLRSTSATIELLARRGAPRESEMLSWAEEITWGRSEMLLETNLRVSFLKERSVVSPIGSDALFEEAMYQLL